MPISRVGSSVCSRPVRSIASSTKRERPPGVSWRGTPNATHRPHLRSNATTVHVQRAMNRWNDFNGASPSSSPTSGPPCRCDSGLGDHSPPSGEHFRSARTRPMESSAPRSARFSEHRRETTSHDRSLTGSRSQRRYSELCTARTSSRPARASRSLDWRFGRASRGRRGRCRVACPSDQLIDFARQSHGGVARGSSDPREDGQPALDSHAGRIGTTRPAISPRRSRTATLDR